MVSTTVVGSYPRIGETPQEQRLRRALAKFDEGTIAEEELRSVERSIVKEVVEEQRAAGISLPTDGEITWYDSQSHFARHFDGWGKHDGSWHGFTLWLALRDSLVSPHWRRGRTCRQSP